MRTVFSMTVDVSGVVTLVSVVSTTDVDLRAIGEGVSAGSQSGRAMRRTETHGVVKTSSVVKTELVEGVTVVTSSTVLVAVAPARVVLSTKRVVVSTTVVDGTVTTTATRGSQRIGPCARISAYAFGVPSSNSRRISPPPPPKKAG